MVSVSSISVETTTGSAGRTSSWGGSGISTSGMEMTSSTDRSSPRERAVSSGQRAKTAKWTRAAAISELQSQPW